METFMQFLLGVLWLSGQGLSCMSLNFFKSNRIGVFDD